MGLPSINWRDRQLILLIPILCLAAFLRFYRLAATLDFNGDLGRDALVAKRIILDRKFTLIGPRASGGTFFLGPFYYYLITPALWVFKFSPLGPVYLTALFGLLTVILIYWVGGQFFDKETALLSALLYATSPLVVRYSRVSGNYTILPFFSLLAVFFLWHWFETRKISNLLLGAVFFGLALQLHYSTIALLFFTVLSFLVYRVNPLCYKKQFLVAGLIFGVINSPLVLFDLRHNWVNCRGLADYFLSGSGGEVRKIVGVGPWSFWDSLEFLSKTSIKVISPIFTDYWGGRIVIILLGIMPFLIYKKMFMPAFGFLLFSTLFSLIFASFYRGYLADYYLVFIFPLPILLFASLLATFSRRGKVLLGVSLTAILIVLICNFSNLPFKSSDRSIRQIEEAARIIAGDVSPGSRFNLFLKRKTPFWSTASEYRYLVEIMGKRALEPTEYRDSETLYFIAETEVLDPLKVGDWEITEFEPKKILKTWDLSEDVRVYKLGK